jgi:hypothetical protein
MEQNAAPVMVHESKNRSFAARRIQRLRTLDRHRLLDIGILAVILVSGLSDFVSLDMDFLQGTAIAFHIGVHVLAGLGILHHILKD